MRTGLYLKLWGESMENRNKNMREALKQLSQDKNLGWVTSFYGEKAKIVDIAQHGLSCVDDQILILIPPQIHAKLLKNIDYINTVKEEG